MYFLPLISLALTFASAVFADSTSRNPIDALAVVQNATIHTKTGRIHHLSTFDISFRFYNHFVKLSLEPNHDVIAEGATIQRLGPDGTVQDTELIVREDHRVFKGTAWLSTKDGVWERVGWARLALRRDGKEPLFGAAFTIRRNHHHIQTSSNYRRTKLALDPAIEDSDDEYMVLWRDSDVSSSVEGHSELKRDLSKNLCQADSLAFNQDPAHPVYAKMLRRDQGFWAASFDSLLGKRQIDGTPGNGNSAGVNLASTIGSTDGCPTSRRVALVGVATDCTYTDDFPTESDMRENVIAQMNQASDIYERTFNITLGIQNLIISPANCPGTPADSTPWNVPCSDTVTITDRLNLFSNWRGQQQDQNSHWTLLSTCNTDAAVGLAWLGQACTQGSQQNGQGSDRVAGANVVVKTPAEWQVIAHETGHTFGAVHDCDENTCADGVTVSSQNCCPLSTSSCDARGQFIMNPSTSDSVDAFSLCSIGNICTAFRVNSVDSQCFTSNRNVDIVTEQQCGNGIVEEGEQCDCGGPDGCGTNQCCDPATCQFTSGSVCDDSNEDCCNQCQFASAQTICRESTSSCDPEERCTGNDAICPNDVTTPDGDECGNGLTCASGQCTSRDQQCKTVMGTYLEGNQTYACDPSRCTLACASPEFGRQCFTLSQNFLDGTDCGGGGRCQNGQCQGSSLGGQIRSWIDRNRGVVIGVSAGVGSLVVICILCCIASCCRRKRRRSRAPPAPPPGSVPPQGFYGGRRGGHHHDSRTPMVPHNQVNSPPMAHFPQNQGGWNGPMPPTYQRGSSVRYA